MEPVANKVPSLTTTAKVSVASLLRALMVPLLGVKVTTPVLGTIEMLPYVPVFDVAGWPLTRRP